MNAKSASKIQPTLKKRAAGTTKMGVHKDAYALYSGPGRKPRAGRVTVTVDVKAVRAAFRASSDANAPHGYNPVILPSSHSITR